MSKKLHIGMSFITSGMANTTYVFVYNVLRSDVNSSCQPKISDLRHKLFIQEYVPACDVSMNNLSISYRKRNNK